MAGIVAAAFIGSWAGKCVVSFPIASCVGDGDDAHERVGCMSCTSTTRLMLVASGIDDEMLMMYTGSSSSSGHDC